MSERITERSLYPVIIRLFEDVASRYRVKASGVQEVETGGRYPDILLHINGRRLLIQVKIDRVSKLIEDIVKSYPIARRYNAELIGLLFPSEVRRIAPIELNKVAPKLIVSRALVLTEWLSSDFEGAELAQVIGEIVREFVKFRRTPIPIVNYLTIAKVARETIEELAYALRKYMGVEKYFSMAQAVIGRFDFYKSLLEDLVEREEVMRTYVADIIAYLVVLQLLFSYVVSVKKYGRSVLPDIADPLAIPDTLIEDLKKEIELWGLHEVYKEVIGSLPYLLEVLKEIATKNKLVLLALGRYIYAIKVLRPEHVKEELLGRIYQEGLPPETRKNLGAFFTNPRAAKLLAELAVDEWSEKVLDPACGSGTLLVSAYWAKMKKAEEQGVSMDKNLLHKLFVNEHIVGIDVMQFAKELATINLAFQNLEVTDVRPRIYCGDGIEKMVQAVEVKCDDPPAFTSILDYIKSAVREYEELTLPREGFNIVIMNPPFTRRERIPQRERSKLERLLGSVVSGKVGYWAYFFAAADNVIKPYGKLAAVTPEEFFAGRSAEYLRRYMLLGENSDYRYMPKYIIRSAVEVAFSEGALYRDYLVVLRKEPKATERPLEDCMFFIILKKRKDELKDEDIERIASTVRKMKGGSISSEVYSSDAFDVMKVRNVGKFIEKHVNNLKPLIGFNCLNAQKLFLELLNSIGAYPTLGEIADLVIYNPGQYTARGGGVEEYARRLFIARYGARGKVSFRFERESVDKVLAKITSGKADITVVIDKKYLKPSLRTLSGVKHMDLTGELEYVITDISALKPEQWIMAGFTDASKLLRALQDVVDAYRDKANRILITRRCQLTSPNVYWLAFYSNTPTLFTTSPFLALRLKKNSDYVWYKVMTLYLNSVVTYLQILGYFVESRGAWGTIHAELVWSNVIVPDPGEVHNECLEYALQVFRKVSKANVRSLYERISSGDPVQRVIDEAALRLLGLRDWASRLDELYNAIKCELDALQRILEESRREKRKSRLREARPGKKRPGSPGSAMLALDRWFKLKGG